MYCYEPKEYNVFIPKDKQDFSFTIHGKKIRLEYRHTKCTIIEDKTDNYYHVPVHIRDEYNVYVDSKLMIDTIYLNYWNAKVNTRPLKDITHEVFTPIKHSIPVDGVYKVAKAKDKRLGSRHFNEYKKTIKNKVTNCFHNPDDYLYKEVIDIAHNIGKDIRGVELDDHELVLINGFVYSNCKGVGYRFNAKISGDNEPSEATEEVVINTMHDYLIGCVDTHQSHVVSTDECRIVGEILDGVKCYIDDVSKAYSYSCTVAELYNLFKDDYTDADIDNMQNGYNYGEPIDD